MLRNRKDQEERKLIGVNRAADPSKLKLGAFESLQNWIPGKRYKLKKKRGPELLVSDARAISAQSCGGACLADPEPQAIPLAHYYNYREGVSLGDSNTAGNMNYVKPGTPEEFIAWVSIRSGFGSGYPGSVDTDFQIVRCVNEAIVGTVTPVPLPFGDDSAFFFGQEAQSGKNGHADVLSYAFSGGYTSPTHAAVGEGAFFFFDYENTQAYPLRQSVLNGKWAKRGNTLWTTRASGGFQHMLEKWTLSAGTFPASTTVTDDVARVYFDIHATDSFLWVMASESGALKLYKKNLTSMADIAGYTISGVASGHGICGMYMLNDDFMLMVTEAVGGASITHVYGFKPSTSTLTLLNVVVDAGIAMDGAAGTYFSLNFASGYLYFTRNGFSGATETSKTGPLLCPGTLNPWIPESEVEE